MRDERARAPFDPSYGTIVLLAIRPHREPAWRRAAPDPLRIRSVPRFEAG
jgi:hypothetical protein